MSEFTVHDDGTQPPPAGHTTGRTDRPQHLLAADANPGMWVSVPVKDGNIAGRRAVYYRKLGYEAMRRDAVVWLRRPEGWTS